MPLPSMVSAGSKTEYQAIGQGGLNLTESPSAGELSDSYGVTTDSYPVLTTRKNRQGLGAYTRPTSIYYWDGLVVVDGTRLLYDGQVVGNVTEGEKQFAVVNTKLCIFPDKVYLDLNDRAVRNLAPKFNVAANTATFGEHGITISSAAPLIKTDSAAYPFGSASPKYVKTYTSLAFDNGAWVKSGEQEKLVQDIADNDLLIPSVNASGVVSINIKENGTWSGEENSIGVYVKITSHSKSSVTTERQWEKFNCVSSYYTYYTQTAWDVLSEWHEDYGYTGYSFNSSTGEFKTTGSEKTVGPSNPGTVYRGGGDTIFRVVFSGDTGTAYYREAQGPYSGIDYGKGSTSYGLVRGAPGTYPSNGRASDGYWYVDRGETGFDGTETLNFDVRDAAGANGVFTNYFEVGDRLRISGAVTHPENNTPANQYITVTSVSEYNVTFSEALTAGTDSGAIIVTKPVPDLDYICSSDNRLWGVSNSDKTIYASALGKPGDFFDFDGLESDSWAVAVGSDRDWTGIAAYSDAVLCWKENVLHKVMGNNPSEYYMTTYTVNGVEAGSNASMQVVNEVLYYKGIDGIYAYAGGVPTLISTEFGTRRYRYAVSGSDDLHYYVSMERTDGSGWVLFVYNILRGLWIKEDNIRCNSFTEQDNKVLFLSDNVIYMTGQNNDEVISWMAEYAPNYETHSSQYSTSASLNRKDYLRLVIRVEVNGTLLVEFKTDDDPWRTAKHVSTDWTKVITVPLPPIRCDKFQIRLSGEGTVVIREIDRELTVGSKK